MTWKEFLIVRTLIVGEIYYRIQGSTLYVFGTPDADLDRKTLVLPLSSKHQRMLKELWIHEVSNPAIYEKKAEGGFYDWATSDW